MPKSTFDTEQEANDYKREHQLLQRVAVPLFGRGKWALIFPIEAHITVNDGAPDGMREPSGNLSNYIEHPASGKTGTFAAKYDQHAERDGQTFTVLGAVDPKTYDATECGEMFSIRFTDGVQIEAWPEEVQSAMNMANYIEPSTMSAEAKSSLVDGAVLGQDADGGLIQWNGAAGAPYNSGQTVEEFGVSNLSDAEMKRLNLPSVRAIEALASLCQADGRSQAKGRFAELVGMSPDRFVSEVDGGRVRVLAEKLVSRFSDAAGAVMQNDLNSWLAGLGIEGENAIQASEQATTQREVTKLQRGYVPTGAIDVTRPLMTRDGVFVDRVERLPGPEHEFVLFGVLHGEDQHWRANGSFALDGRICDSDLIYRD